MAIEDIERLKEKIEKDPNSKLFVPLAEEYKKAGMFDEAIDVLSKGLERQPTYLSARVSLGKIYIERGVLDEARAEFEKVVAVIPDNLYAHKKLAEIYKDQGKRDEAIKELKTVLRLNPTDEWAATSLSNIDKEPAVRPQEPSVTKAEEPSPAAKQEMEVFSAPAEPAETVEGKEIEPPLTARDLELSEIIAEESKGEQEVEEEAQGISLGGEESAEIPFSGEEIEPWGASPEPVGDNNEKGAEPALREQGTEVWNALSEPTEEIREEREAPPKTAISKEDMDLWRAHLEATGEIDMKTEEETETEPVLEVEELPEEEPVSFRDVLSQQETGLRAAPLEETVSVAPVSGASAYDADKWILEGKYGEAMNTYRKVLSADPGNRTVLQRIEELRALLKLLGKDKEELVMKLESLLDGIKKRRDEFSGAA